MKRKMLLFTLALPVFLSQNAQAQTSSRLVGAAHSQNSGATFKPVDSSAYAYSGGRGGDLTHTKKFDNSTSWVYLGDTAYSNNYNYLQTFDANNNMLTNIIQYWSGTDWVLSTKELYSYDTATMKLSSMIVQTWGGSSWVPASKNVYTYVSGKLIADQTQVWNGLTSSFDRTSQKNYLYDAVTGLLTNTTNVMWVSGVLTNVDGYTYTYTGANMPWQTTYITWNGAGWDNVNMETNTYDTTGNKINMLAQVYDMGTSSWVNTVLHNYSSFTSAHNPMTDVKQTWDTTGGGMWKNQMQYNNTYNAYGQLTSKTGESWNIVGAFEFALGDPMYNYYYETYNPSSVAVKPVAADASGVSVYPVPASNMLHVDLNWKEAQAATITIYDMTGRVMNQWTSDFGTQYFSAVSVNNLATGSYFVKVSGAQGETVKQFVVAH